MKKFDNNGFVLAETLIVTVFLMVLFAMIYSNFYPLVGEYEKRETYDDVDGKYTAYWVKRMIEDSSYTLSTGKSTFFNTHGFVRFECSDITDADKQNICISLMKKLEIKGCNSRGKNCEAYITRYQLRKNGDTSGKYFKDVIKNNNLVRNNETYNGNFISNCVGNIAQTNEECTSLANKKIFSSAFRDYIISLPDYSAANSLNNAKYRVIVMMQTKTDNNNYYSYATIEVSK
jgi:hypothetical protein